MVEIQDVVVIGAGQAGLCISSELASVGIQHIVLERGKIGQSWRGRWDSFCLVLPNWTIRLSGHPYAGPDPDGFMPRDEFVSYLCSYAASFQAPIREQVNVKSLEAGPSGSFLLRTTTGEIQTKEVVVASGGYQKTHWPVGIGQLPKSISVLDVDRYKNPSGLPPGKVLIIGSGQSGCQIAEDVRLAGRDVYLSCGRAPWVPRRIADKDVTAWLADSTLLRMTLEDLPSPASRLIANIQLSGRGGGHDLNFRTLQSMGVRLVGHFLGVENGSAKFAADLAESVSFGDARYAEICESIKKTAQTRGTPVPSMPTPPPFIADPSESIPLTDLGAVIVTSGFRPDYASWIRFPEAFDAMGFPIQQDGSSTVVPGLHFMGVHFQRTRMSATLLGVAEDAHVLVGKMVAARRAT